MVVTVGAETRFGMLQDFDFCFKIDLKRFGSQSFFDSREPKNSLRHTRSLCFISDHMFLNFSLR